MCNVWSDAKDILNQQIKAKSHLISAKTNTMPILTKVFHITSDTFIHLLPISLVQITLIF